MAKLGPQISGEIGRILAEHGLIDDDLANIRSISIYLHAEEAPRIYVERFIDADRAAGLKGAVRTLVDRYDITRRSEVGLTDDQVDNLVTSDPGEYWGGADGES